MPRPLTRESLAAIHARHEHAHREACAGGHHKFGGWQQDEDGRAFWDCAHGCGHRHRDTPSTLEETAAEDGCAAYQQHLDREARRPPTRAEQCVAGSLIAAPVAVVDDAGIGFPVVFTHTAWERCGCDTPDQLAAVLRDVARALQREGASRFFALRSIAVRASLTSDRDGAFIVVRLPKE